ncbi:SAM-dependent methyltransferase [Spongiibacter taiwanensis]|uniref:tRNA (guanine(46)-N(7))-methyltransferase TrmB n=1 Tax=Spongiibacter taiwanensis TaxID=1748242 RepID=UPI00203613D8|nr:SAM-dependent methyltransferase [Spongiibacter taiwanensis]USA42485.1 SAM-dependent methyltransferase [Spongiibacter taiwanensis]
MKKTNNALSPRIITSSQVRPHDKLAATVARHLAHPFRKPFASHNVDAFHQTEHWLARQPATQSIIFDSFCGVGESTYTLAERYPDSLVIGIDKSAHRLGKHLQNHAIAGEHRDNYLLVRADVDDFWRLAAQAGWQLAKHYLLYPNPWPKPGQLKYRVQGSAVFPALLQLGGEIELRSNWPVYVEEFALALNLAGQPGEVSQFQPDPPITPFERKYSVAGQTLWRCRCSVWAENI